MITVVIPKTDYWDESREEFVSEKEVILNLEHSLISISKWESKWNKIFLVDEDKSLDETISYVKCMTLNHVDPDVYYRLSVENLNDINQYIAAPMTATYFNNDESSRPSREQTSSELIYYWMITLNIPFECQKWHLNRLLTLIRVCNVKNAPPKKMSSVERARQNAAINAQRRKQFNTKG